MRNTKQYISTNPPDDGCNDERLQRAHAQVIAPFGVAGKAGFEPATCGLEVRCSVQLSYLPFFKITRMLDGMPSKPPPHSVRFPDYSIPYNKVGYLSTAQFILSYAQFYNKWQKRDNKPEYFTYADHQAMRSKNMRKDVWEHAVKRLISFGWIETNGSGYKITPEGIEAARRVAARNAGRPDRYNLNKD